MACPTCSHTMASIGDVAARRVFHCERCGTVKIETYTGDPQNWRVEVYTPKLVERCREFEQQLNVVTTSARNWRTLGIAESINTPENRKYKSGGAT